ncbi:glycosyltransferase [Hafnia alvei]|uniref:glycosyltransferase n=1 Tax=Hafnia alvei TaxID=569 RepID=UPI0024A7F730|nr:glycosyltransferase [Hafnia alvei]
MDEKKFSILMSLYKKESPDNLEECFASIEKQTLRPSEIICVFDGEIGSDLESIVFSWENKLNIKIIRLKYNVGLGKALNAGLEHCSFDLVARMDTDDICKNDRFEKQISLMNNKPNLALLGSYISEFESDISCVTGVRYVPEAYESIISYCRVKNPFNHMTVVFRKKDILNVGGYQHHPYMEDYNLWLRVISAGLVVENLPEVLVYARVGKGMLKRRSGLSYIKSEYELAKLKVNLNVQSIPSALTYFFLRSLPRLLPLSVLSYIYKSNRKNN